MARNQGIDPPLYSCRAFTGFGPRRLAGESAAPPHSQVTGRRPLEFRCRLREHCPRQPGVYGMLDINGDLLYIGKAKNLRARLLSYFRPRSRARKSFRVAVRTRSIVWEAAADEFAALLRELELIQRFRPRLNVRGQPLGLRRVYVCLSAPPVPGIFLKRRPTDSDDAYGPLLDGPHVRQAVRCLNDVFLLRDCPQTVAMTFAPEKRTWRAALPHAAACIRHGIGTCLGPCAAFCTAPAYDDQVRAARAFLQGTDLTALERLERDMIDAGSKLAFERAAGLRDRLDGLRRLEQRLRRLRGVQQTHSFVYPVAGVEGATWYVIRNGRVLAALPEPRSAKEKQEVAQRVAAVYNAPVDPPSPDQLAAIHLVAAWFRRRAAERHKVMMPDCPDRARGAHGTGLAPD